MRLRSLVVPLAVVMGAAPAAWYDEPLRPRFHFTPARNFMNDPNGLVFHAGEYHLFYQHNPFGEKWGHMSWGHAVSPDMLHWKHLPVAIGEEGGIMIFSGSVVADPDDTSGLCRARAAGSSCLVAIYTGHGQGKQTQNLAWSTDRGRTWTKYAGNPVLDLGLKDFRDPKAFWHAPTRRWVLVTVLPDQHKVASSVRPTSSIGPRWAPSARREQRAACGSARTCTRCPSTAAPPTSAGCSTWISTPADGPAAPADSISSAPSTAGPS